MTLNVWVCFAYEGHWLGIDLDGPQLDGTVRDVNGLKAAKLYLTGDVVEKSLAMDNMFVIATIFTYFKVPSL